MIVSQRGFQASTKVVSTTDQILEEAKAYKVKLIKSAEGEALRFKQLFTEYEKSPVVTRERLYLESVESVLGNTTKVMIDLEGGNNLLYLPLDKILEDKRNNESDSVSTQNSSNNTSLVDKIRMNRDSFNNRKRDLYNEQ